jgi:aspartate/methionine/tyrosine aminotransferase
MNPGLKFKSAFKETSDIGVIWVLDEAKKLGYYNGNPEWVNMGQGQPEVGALKGAPARINDFVIEPGDDRYGPLNGMQDLREAIANHYNRLYRKVISSKYTAENVSLAMGGRLALTRIFSIIGSIRLGFKTPEYPAYENLLNNQQKRITAVSIPSKKKNNYSIPPDEFAEAIEKFRLGAFLFSNPCNPTGHVIKGRELKEYLQHARNQNCVLIIDEMYSHYIYDNGKPGKTPVSSAEYIRDVNSEPVLIVDGLTKSFRYPGWRLGWILGPKNIIETLGMAASGIDGGPSLPIQRAALQLFEPNRVDKEMQSLREVFNKKQCLILNSLRENGMICSADNTGTFYIWADISQLPAPLNNADDFFKEALKIKVIIVPGHMFDIHPGHQKKQLKFNQYVRFSFGPEEENLKMGLKKITELIKSH